jgi:hypothetical protein
MTHVVLARRGALSGAILIAGCLLLAACSSGSGMTSASSAEGNAAGTAGRAPNGTVNGSGSYGSAVAAPSARSASAQHGAAGTAAVTTGLTTTGQSIIYTASMTVRSGNVAATASRVASIVAASGGYTADEHVVSGRTGTTGEQISITLKIPVPAYQSVLAQLSSPAIGKQITMQQRAMDVTQEVANVNSLVTSEQDAIAALQGLLKRAGSVADLLQVQQQISGEESNLNSLLAQQRALDHETSFATVTMTLQSVVHKAAHTSQSRHRGFVAGLGAGWRALKHVTTALLTGLGAALPFLVVIAILGGIGYAGRRRLVRRKPEPTVTE